MKYIANCEKLLCVQRGISVACHSNRYFALFTQFTRGSIRLSVFLFFSFLFLLKFSHFNHKGFPLFAIVYQKTSSSYKANIIFANIYDDHSSLKLLFNRITIMLFSCLLAEQVQQAFCISANF